MCLCAAVAVSPALAAGGKAAASEKKTVTLEYCIWSDEEPYIRDVVDRWNADRKDIQVNLTVIPNNDYDNKIKVLLSAKASVDLLGVRTLSEVLQFQTTKSLLDITDRIKRSDLDVSAYGSMFNNITVNGRYYGLPARSSCWVLYYNKDIFDKAGVPYPKQMTWTQYRELAKRMTSGEGKDKVWGSYWFPFVFQAIATQQAAYLIDDDLTLVRKSLEMVNDFYNIDKSHMSYFEIAATSPSSTALFESGRLAMLPVGEWTLSTLKSHAAQGKTNVNWDIAPMPITEGREPGTTWGQFAFVGINSATKKADAAFEFMKYICGENGARIYAKHAMLPAYCDDEIKKIYVEAVGKESSSVFFGARKVQEQPPYANYNRIDKVFQEQAQLYFLGEKTLDETMAEFVKRRAALVK